MFTPLILAASSWWVLSVIILIFLIGWGGFVLVDNWRQKRYTTTLTADQFEKGKHRAQLIDLRNENQFKDSHIIGARNIPYVMLRQRYEELRPDMPVYLYDMGESVSVHAAAFLYKKGYHDLYILKGGFNEWEGRTKKSKY